MPVFTSHVHGVRFALSRMAKRSRRTPPSCPVWFWSGPLLRNISFEWWSSQSTALQHAYHAPWTAKLGHGRTPPTTYNTRGGRRHAGLVPVFFVCKDRGLFKPTIMRFVAFHNKIYFMTGHGPRLRAFSLARTSREIPTNGAFAFTVSRATDLKLFLPAVFRSLFCAVFGGLPGFLSYTRWRAHRHISCVLHAHFLAGAIVFLL